MSNLTWTALRNPKLMTKIIIASRMAQLTGLPRYVTNRKGTPVVRVAYQAGVLTFYRGNKNLIREVNKAFKDFKANYRAAA